MGTEQFPVVDEYERYLAENQGECNAYTSAEETNYFFEVNHEAFEGALDRFAGFFTAPLFDPEYIDRELESVHSEHQIHRESDYWRIERVKELLHREGHPRRRFSTGDRETLSGVSRDEMVEFHRRWYSANLMKLCLQGVVSLDELERLARGLFATVPDRELEEPSFPREVYDPGELPRMIRVRPLQDQRTLQLGFALPPAMVHSASKPLALLGSLIGHEGRGSLLSQLKREHLATALETDAEHCSYCSYFTVDLSLTEKGLRDTDRVIELFFSYLAMLREDGLRRYYYEEERTMSELGYYYRNKYEGAELVATLASEMHFRPGAEVLKDMMVIREYRPRLFQAYLGQLVPERLNAVLVSPEVEVDHADACYGVEYSVRRLSPESLRRARAAERHPALSYPEPNPYIPDDLDLLPPSRACRPQRLIDDERGVFWFEQDSVFQLPRGRILLSLLSDEPARGPRNRLLTKLYAKALTQELAEWAYPAREAGLKFLLLDTDHGVDLYLWGFSQRLPALLRDLEERLDRITLDAATLEGVKDELARRLANSEYIPAYRQALLEESVLLTRGSLHPRDLVDLVESITLKELREFAAGLYEDCAFEGVACGNLEAVELRSAVERFYAGLAENVLSRELRGDELRLDLPEGRHLARVFSTQSDNHCWLTYVEFGARCPHLEALLRLGSSRIEHGFYNELRTQQQLGYAVFGSADYEATGTGFLFLIQSAEYPAAELARRAWTWLEQEISSLGEMRPEEFEQLRSAVVQDLERRDANLYERLQTLEYLALELNGDFEHREKVKRELLVLEPRELGETFRNAFLGEAKTALSVYLDAIGSETTRPEGELIIDPMAFNTRWPAWPSP